MIVMRIAITPSLSASSRLLGMARGMPRRTALAASSADNNHEGWTTVRTPKQAKRYIQEHP